ncbi:cell division protein FtsA [bacterium]|nr:cell division protein FtsA [bacterium]
MAQLQTLTALDIGSSKVVCVIGGISPDGGLSVLARGIAPCFGVSNGVIVDSGQTVEAIIKAVAEAETSGYSASPVLVGLTSENLVFRMGHGVTAVANKEGEITNADKERAEASASMVGVPSDHEIVSTATRAFNVDGQKDIINPVGLSGVRLEAEAYICTAPMHYTQNIRRVIEKAGLHISKQGFLPVALASALAVLTDEERDVGALVVDIGMGVSDLSVHSAKEVGHAAVLAKGGRFIADDVAGHFNITKSEAERLFREYGIAAAEYLSPKVANEQVTALSASGDTDVRISRRELADVIEARLQEIIGWVKEHMAEAREQGLAVSGVVLTGGVSLLPAIDHRFSKDLGVTVRVAAPCRLEAIPKNLDSPLFSATVGLLAFGAHMAKNSISDETDDRADSHSGPFGWFWKIADWCSRMFT